MTTIPKIDFDFVCPHCGHDHTMKRGHDPYGRQRYSCVRCERTFTHEGWLRAHTRAARMASAAVSVRDGILSVHAASRVFKLRMLTVLKMVAGDEDSDAAVGD